jgi:hypothetical protein
MSGRTVDRHPTDRVDNPVVSLVTELDLPQLDRFDHVAQRDITDRSNRTTSAVDRICDHGSGQHLVASRMPRDARSEVDGRAEQVAIALHDRPVMKTGP